MNESILLPSLLAATVAVFAHACFQLAVSVLTLLSSHSLGRKKSHLRLLHLSTSYVGGAFFATLGIVCFITFALGALSAGGSYLGWALVAGLNTGVGVAVLAFYYRKGKGTMLWLPRPAVDFLGARAKKTNKSFEAFGLGIMTVVAELPFLIAPTATVALLIAKDFPANAASLGWALVYVFAVTLPLLAVTFLISSGHRISTIQRWREANKTFLQATSGGALIVLGFFILAKFGFGGQS